MIILHALACFLAINAAAEGVEFAMGDLNIPQYDAAGHLIRRLRAESMTGSVQQPLLKNGLVVFFRPVDPPGESIGTLDFSEALYERSKGVIESEGAVRLTSLKGKLSSHGFRYELAQGRLILKSDVSVDLPAGHIVGKHGEVLLSQELTHREYIVSRATIEGDVVATGISDEKYAFDRAETQLAVYTEEDGLLRLASPVTTWIKGEKSIVEGDIKINVGRQSLPRNHPSVR